MDCSNNVHMSYCKPMKNINSFIYFNFVSFFLVVAVLVVVSLGVRGHRLLRARSVRSFSRCSPFNIHTIVYWDFAGGCGIWEDVICIHDSLQKSIYSQFTRQLAIQGMMTCVRASFFCCITCSGQLLNAIPSFYVEWKGNRARCGNCIQIERI